MSKREIAVKKYVVELSAEERERLEALIHAAKNSARMLTRARILLKADVSEAGEGWSDSAISAALDTSVNNVARTRQQLVEEGFEATLRAQVQCQLRQAADIRRWGEMANRAAARPLDRHRMRRLLSPFEENVASRAHAAQVRAVLPKDGALVANRFESILGRSRL